MKCHTAFNDRSQQGRSISESHKSSKREGVITYGRIVAFVGRQHTPGKRVRIERPIDIVVVVYNSDHHALSFKKSDRGLLQQMA